VYVPVDGSDVRSIKPYAFEKLICPLEASVEPSGFKIDTNVIGKLVDDIVPVNAFKNTFCPAVPENV